MGPPLSDIDHEKTLAIYAGLKSYSEACLVANCPSFKF